MPIEFKKTFTNGPGKLFKDSKIVLPPQTTLLGDSGYQGIKKLHSNSQTPCKKPPRKRKTKDSPNPQPTSLTKQQKQENTKLSSQRISVEHVKREIKIFKIASERYRNRRKRFGLRVNLISGWYNFLN